MGNDNCTIMFSHLQDKVAQAASEKEKKLEASLELIVERSSSIKAPPSLHQQKQKQQPLINDLNMCCTNNSFENLLPLPPTTTIGGIEEEKQNKRERIPQRERKLSVFSFDGFPDIQLLDQQNIKGPTSVDRKEEQMEVQIEERRLSQISSLSESSNPAEKVKGNHTMATIETMPNVSSNQQRRSIRQDTLGSNGSSRASSCDEPTVTTLANNSSSSTSANSVLVTSLSSCLSSPSSSSSSDLSSASSAANISSIIAQTANCIISASDDHDTNDRKVSTSSQTTINPMSSSSSSSLDSIGNSNCSQQTNQETSDASGQQQQQQATRLASPPPVNEANSELSAIDIKRTAPAVAPFESIKTQLKRNSVPNAQVIRHIDNLISQNEAIIDNWNLVSIRSYTSSSRQPESTTISSPTSTATQPQALSDDETKKAESVTSAQTQVPITSTTATAASSNSLLSSPIKRPKRWSTAMMSPNQMATLRANSSNFGYSATSCKQHQNDLNHQHLTTSSLQLACDTNNIDTSTNQQAINFRWKQLERKRSYNLAKLSHNYSQDSSTILSSQQNCSHQNSNGNNHLLTTPASSTQSLGVNLSLAHHSSMPTSPTPAQSSSCLTTDLKTILDLQFSGQQAGSCINLRRQQQQQTAPLQLENAIQNLSLRRRDNDLDMKQEQPQFGEHSQVAAPMFSCLPLPMDHHQQNLINQYQHQHQQQHQSTHDQIVMAALLMERHRQSLVAAELYHQQLQKDLENQVAMLRQQQTIEQQLAAVMELHRQNDQQHRLAINATRDNHLETIHSDTVLARQPPLVPDLNILKQQLLTMQSTNNHNNISKVVQTNLPVPHESLPFKKRKISEPNMRY